MRWLVGVLALLLLTPGLARSIEIWRTPDGKTHLGSNPPPGSKLLRDTPDVESSAPAGPEEPRPAEPPAPAGDDAAGDVPGAPAEAEERAFSTRVSLERSRIEKELNRAAGALPGIESEIERVENTRITAGEEVARDPATGGEVSAVARFAAEKQVALDDLARRKEQTLERIDQLWAEHGRLNAEVTTFYGAYPSWWRSDLRCPRCPSRRAAAGETSTE